MQHFFLFDENTVYVGVLGTPIEATRLWAEFGASCHALLLTDELIARYLGHIAAIAEAESETQSTLSADVILGILTDADRTIYVSPKPLQVTEHRVRHMNDWFLEDAALAFVRDQVASHDHCMLVTTDSQTRKDFNHAQLAAEGLSGLTVRRGYALSKEPCD